MKEEKQITRKEREKGKIKGHMTQSDRLLIEKCLNEGKNFKETARIVGKSQTTISREIKAHFVEIKYTLSCESKDSCKNAFRC